MRNDWKILEYPPVRSATTTLTPAASIPADWASRTHRPATGPTRSIANVVRNRVPSALQEFLSTDLVFLEATPDGNCLRLWGVESGWQDIRTRILIELRDNAQFYAREAALGDQRSLELAVLYASLVGHSLGSAHLWAVANCLRRTVILLCSDRNRSSYGEGEGGCAGVYVPSRFPVEQWIDQAPIILAWANDNMDHYAAICARQGRRPPMCIPSIAFAAALTEEQLALAPLSIRKYFSRELVLRPVTEDEVIAPELTLSAHPHPESSPETSPALGEPGDRPIGDGFESRPGGMDPYWKLQPLMDAMNDRYRRFYVPGRSISRDEQIICNNHRTALRHMRLPKRFHTVGIRVECITTPKGIPLGCMIDMPGVTHEWQTMELAKSLPFSGHILFMDRMYMSFRACKLLLGNRQYVCGTSRSDRGFPAELVAVGKGLVRGRWTCLYRSGVWAYTWSDSSVVQFLSTVHEPEEVTIQRRQKGQAGKVNRTAPSVAAACNAGMGGNDVGDQYRSRATCHVTSLRWHMGHLFYHLDQVMVATVQIWKELRPKFHLTTRQIIEDVIRTLARRAGKPIKPSTHNRKRRHSVVATDVRILPIELTHWPIKILRSERRCSQCRKLAPKNLSTPHAPRPRVRLHCNACDVDLCEDCYLGHIANL